MLASVTPRPDTPAVGPETPGKMDKISLNSSLSLSTLTQLSLLSFFFLHELVSFPHRPPSISTFGHRIVDSFHEHLPLLVLHLSPSPFDPFLGRNWLPTGILHCWPLEAPPHASSPIVRPSSARIEQGVSFTASFSTLLGLSSKFFFLPAHWECHGRRCTP